MHRPRAERPQWPLSSCALGWGPSFANPTAASRRNRAHYDDFRAAYRLNVVADLKCRHKRKRVTGENAEQARKYRNIFLIIYVTKYMITDNDSNDGPAFKYDGSWRVLGPEPELGCFPSGDEFFKFVDQIRDGLRASNKRIEDRLACEPGFVPIDEIEF